VPALRQPLPINLATAPPLYLQTQSSSASLAVAAATDSRRSSLVSGPESAEDAGVAGVSPNTASLLRGPMRRVRHRTANVARRASGALTVGAPARPTTGACVQATTKRTLTTTSTRAPPSKTAKAASKRELALQPAQAMMVRPAAP